MQRSHFSLTLLELSVCTILVPLLRLGAGTVVVALGKLAYETILGATTGAEGGTTETGGAGTGLIGIPVP